MEQKSMSRPGARGLTVKQLTFIFIAGVVVCAIFFTLGFLVGANERNTNAAGTLSMERVSPSGDIPPPVNQPLSPPESSSANASSTTGSSGQVQEQNLPSSGPANPAPTADQSTSPPPAVSSPSGTAKSIPSFASAKSSTSPATHAQDAGLIVQIAALHSAKDAESLVGTLRSQGYSAFLVTPEQTGNNDGVYRVQVGPYATRPEAVKERDKLQKEGFSPFIKDQE